MEGMILNIKITTPFMLEYFEYDFEILFFECELQVGQWMTLTFNLKSRKTSEYLRFLQKW